MIIRRFFHAIGLFGLFTIHAAGPAVPTANAAPEETISFEKLTEGRKVHGFQATAVYLNDADKAMGARFLHEKSGFTLDLLTIQSVPQAFTWVNSFPTSDMGEPHTQEHLLLGKGDVGRAMSNLEGMSLVGSSAYTQQWRTCYFFHTGAGPETFYTLFERGMDALLHPDYSDEEIRREVMNWGVAENPLDGTLRLEEKGTVYQEMVSTFGRPASRLFRAMNQDLYGATHPLAVSSGGHPPAIREMKPEHIRRFHGDNYHLGNMGTIVSVPGEMPLSSVLARMNEILTRLEPEPPRKTFMSEADLPAPKTAPAGAIRIVEYPHQNSQQPGSVFFAWPPVLGELSPEEALLLDLFLGNLAGDATTNLYRKLVDSKTRVIETGATGVFGRADEDQGHPILIGLSNVAPAHMTEEKISEVRRIVTDEIARVAAFPDGSPDLSEFNQRLMNRVTETKRDLSKFVNSPPGFGFRSTSSAWMSQLKQLEKTKDFRKSVTLKNEIASIETKLAGSRNIWKDLVSGWRLLASTPGALAAKSNPELIAEEDRAKQARAEAELERLKARFETQDPQEAIRRYGAEYDSTTAELERLSGESERPPFVENPPLTHDDQLDFTVSSLPGDVPMVTSTFENMTSATTGLALRLHDATDEELIYVSALPALIRNVGVIRDGKPVSFEEMSELLRQEVLSLDAVFGANFQTGRAELVVRGSGNNLAESERALAWMRLLLTSPNWRVENLPRIRDVVDQQLSGLRNRMQGSEESWVNDPADAYWRQDDPLLLSVGSFLTRAHNVYRLRWRLKDPGTDAGREAISAFLDGLVEAGAMASREELKTLLGAMQKGGGIAGLVPESLKPRGADFDALPEDARSLAVEAAKDLDQALSDIPDASLAMDWAYLCREMKSDLLVPPEQALAELDGLRSRLLKTGNARLFQISSSETRKHLEKGVKGLVADLAASKAAPVPRAEGRRIEARLRDRAADNGAPVFVGLVQPNLQTGVFLNSAPGVTYQDTNRDALLDYLATRLYSGRGAHGIFMKTWGAGLAYSNGFRGSVSGGRFGYYAERTPELPQTLRFVIEELKKTPRDPGLAEYAVAQAFAEFRSASSYETRGEAMASDLADNMTPETVTRFRKAILELRDDPALATELIGRMDRVYARVLPGYGTKAADVPGGVFFVIGAEKQMHAYEEYLQSVEGPETRVTRLYPRDFWLPLEEARAPATRP